MSDQNPNREPTWRVAEETEGERSREGVESSASAPPPPKPGSEKTLPCPGCAEPMHKQRLLCSPGDTSLSEALLASVELRFRHAEFSKDMHAAFYPDTAAVLWYTRDALFCCDLCFKPAIPLNAKEEVSAEFFTCSTDLPFLDPELGALLQEDGGEEVEAELRAAVSLSLEENSGWVQHPRGVVLCGTCAAQGADTVRKRYAAMRAQTRQAFCTGQRCKGEAIAQPGFLMGFHKGYRPVCVACLNVCGMSRARAGRDPGFPYVKPRFAKDPLRCQCAAMRDCLFARHCAFEPRMEDAEFRTKEMEKLAQLRRNMLVAPMNPVRGSGVGLEGYVQRRLAMVRNWEKNAWAKRRAQEILQSNFGLLRDACLVGKEEIVEDKEELVSLRDLVETFDVHFATKIERWIWNTFMIWMTHARPKCDKCDNRCHHFKETFQSITFKCSQCQTQRNIPRYHDAFQLLREEVTDRHERFGRCGEFAQINYIMLSCAGFEVRWVDDQNDHVWVEVFSPKHGTWVERGANVKDRNYVFAFSRLGVDDVTPRYAKHRDLQYMVRARQWIPETVLEMFLHNVNQQFGVIERSVQICDPVTNETLRGADKLDPAFQDWMAYRSE